MSAYIFLGQELGKKQDAVNKIREKFKSTAETEEFVFYADETPVSTIVDTLQNQGLFSDSRIVIVKYAEVIKKKDDIDLIVSWTKKNTNDNTALIMLSDENRLAAGFDNAKVNRQVFYEMFESEKNQWLKDFFMQYGIKIDNDCIDTILEMVENNTDALRRECTRLINFVKSKEELTNSLSLGEVEKWLSHNREESAFTLFSRIAAGDLSRALESMSVMLTAKESIPGLLAGLTWCFRKLGDYLGLQEMGNENNSFELKKIGLSSPKSRSDYTAAARRYDSDGVEACLALTAQYDILFRSPVAVMEKVLMDRYILAVMNSGIKSP